MVGVGGGCLFEAGRLLTFPAYRVGAYSRWALIRGWALNRINTVLRLLCIFVYFSSRRGASRFPCRAINVSW